MDRSNDAGRRAKLLFVWLCVALLVTYGVSACSGHISLPPLPELHMPGVSKVPGFEDFYKRNAGDFEHLNDFAAYQPNGPGTIGRVFVITPGGMLDIGLDGSGERKVADDGLCQGRPAVTRDSRWLLCSSYNGQL